jgi:hypothetical protein
MMIYKVTETLGVGGPLTISTQRASGSIGEKKFTAVVQLYRKTTCRLRCGRLRMAQAAAAGFPAFDIFIPIIMRQYLELVKVAR